MTATPQAACRTNADATLSDASDRGFPSFIQRTHGAAVHRNAGPAGFNLEMPFMMRSPFVLALASLVAACATQQPPATQTTAVPPQLRPVDHEKHAFTWHAIGVQIYECRLGEQGKMGWAFVAPQAELFNERNEKVGHHGAGPHWTALDGSKTIGTVKARSGGQRPADIPWLLLSAKSDGTPGKMAAVTSVQRINTEGGNAPAAGCSSAADAGKRVNEGYTSDYVYYTRK